jgi:hypothetical protein
MTAITRRIAAAAALLAAPALIALAAAGYSHADSAVTNTGPSISHPTFPNQHVAAPGSPEHHHHQWSHAK